MSKPKRILPVLMGMFLALSFIAVDQAEARRGGSFGSRGARTFQSAPPTRTAPQRTAPIERSMTPDTRTSSTARPGPTIPRPGFFNGFGGSMLRGVMLGGLIGLLLGHGFGGLAGMFGFLLQALLIGGALMLLLRLFRSQSASAAVPAMGRTSVALAGNQHRETQPRRADAGDLLSRPGIGSGSGTSVPPAGKDEIGLASNDLDAFQRRLTEVQEAFGREDHAALRLLATPEMVSFLSEELADNARKGVRNQVRDVHLMQADVAESWREGHRDYATASFNYSSIDLTRDRNSGVIVNGGDEAPTETTQVWTFVRQKRGDWKVSAIQEA